MDRDTKAQNPNRIFYIETVGNNILKILRALNYEKQ